LRAGVAFSQRPIDEDYCCKPSPDVKIANDYKFEKDMEHMGSRSFLNNPLISNPTCSRAAAAHRSHLHHLPASTEKIFESTSPANPYIATALAALAIEDS